MEYKSRNEVEDKYKSDLSIIFKNDEEFEKAKEELNKNIELIKSYKEDYLKSSKNLYNTLTLYYETSKIIEDLYIYVALKGDFDLSDNDAALKESEIINLLNNFDSATTYIVTDLIKIDDALLNKYYLELEDLKLYENDIKNIIRQKEHLLSEKEEIMINNLTKNYKNFSDIGSILTDSAINYGTIKVDGENKEITSGNYRNFLMNKDRNIRKKAYKLFNEKLRQFRDVFSKSLIGYLDNVNEIAKIRNYSSVLEMKNFSSNIPVEVHDTVNKVCMERLDVYQKYYKLVSKALDIKSLRPYDLAMPLVENNKEYSIEDAKELIINSLSILGDDYKEKLTKMFDEKRIDFCTYKNKRSGAYQTDSYNSGPFVFLNYKYKLDDVSALAHELGHAIHTMNAIENNIYPNYQYDLFVAEVASLTNEILMSNYILNNSNDKEEKMASIYNILEVFQNNFYDAILEGKLEDDVHEMLMNGEAINADILDEIINKYRKQFFGNTVKYDELFISRWARRHHYYRPFYLYMYATGVSAAMYFANKIIDGDKEVLNNYINFLKMGGSDYPVNELKLSGVDMCDEKIYNDAILYFDKLIDEYNKLVEE